MVVTDTTTDGAALQMSDQPGVGDVHTDAPSGAGRKRGNPTTPYLNKMYQNLKAMCGNGPVTREHFAEAVRTSRAHAGGMARAAMLQQQIQDQPANVMPAIRADEGYDVLAPFAPAMPGEDTCTGACCDACNCVGDTGCSCGCSPACGGSDEPDRDADDLPGYEKADPRVKYRAATEVGKQCGLCRFYLGGNGGEEEHECVQVEGWIDPAMVCTLFGPRVAGGTNAVAASEEVEASELFGDGQLQQFNWTDWDKAQTNSGKSSQPVSHGDTVTSSGANHVSLKPAKGSSYLSGHHEALGAAQHGDKVEAVGHKGDKISGSYAGFEQRNAGAVHHLVKDARGSYQTIGLGTKLQSLKITREPKANSEPIDLVSACTVCPVAMGEDERRVSHPNGWAIFTELPQAFIEPPDWMNYLPKPGSYKSERYGKVNVSPERNVRFVKNFKDRVYGQDLPIDLEHETKLSGAAGWIRDMRMNEDGSVDARVEWTDRGERALRANRFQYFSPEFYDKWTDPMRPELGAFSDVAIGGGLTTRPFFKEQALKSLVMSEGGYLVRQFSEEEMGEDDVIDGAQLFTDQTSTTEETTMTEGIQMADDQNTTPAAGAAAPTEGAGAVQTETAAQVAAPAAQADPAVAAQAVQASELMSMAERLVAKEAEIAALRMFNEQQAELTMQMSERIGALEGDKRRKRFTDMVRGVGEGNDGLRWFGEVAPQVEMLELLADTLPDGENNAKFTEHVERMRGLAAQVKTVEETGKVSLFSETGSDASPNGGSDGESAYDRIQGFAKQFVESGDAKTLAQGVAMAAERHPDLYQQHREEHSKRGRE